MTELLKPGIHRGIDFAQYLADPGVNNGALADLDRSPAHCYALHLDPDRPQEDRTPAMLAGSLLHCFVLERGEVENRYVIKPEDVDYRTKAGKAWRDEQTRAIITHDDWERAKAQSAAVLKNAYLRELLHEADTEVTVIWQDAATGLRCKARPDAAKGNPFRLRVLDLKSTADITPRGIARSIATYGYHRQAAHYTNGLQANGYDVAEFVFGFVSSTYPYLAAPYILDDETAQQGRDEVAELLDLYRACTATGEWPLCGAGPQLISLPAYAKRSGEVEISYA